VTVPDLVAEGFSFGLVVVVFTWGMTVPIRFFLKLLGF